MSEVRDINKDLRDLNQRLIDLQRRQQSQRQQINRLKNIGEDITQRQSDLQKTQGSIKQIKIKRENILQRQSDIKRITPPRRRVSYFGGKPIRFEKIIQDYYDKSNYPTEEELKEQIEKHGYSGRFKFKPNSIEEAVARVGYITTELIGGGVREATLGLSGSLGAEKRKGGRTIQAIGGLLTPTPLDYACAAVLNKLGVTRAGRRFIQKITETPLDEKLVFNTKEEAEALRQFEKIVGKSGISTSDLRKVGKKLPKLEEVIGNYEVTEQTGKTLLKKRRGVASILPSLKQETIQYKKLVDDWWEPDSYIDFLKSDEYLPKLGIENDVPAGLLLFTDLKTREKALKEVAKIDVPTINERIEYIDGQQKMLMDRPDANTKPVKVLIQELENIKTNLDTYSDTEDIGKQDDDEPTITIPFEPVVDVPEPPPDFPEPTPPIVLTDKEKKERKKIYLRLFQGSIQVYRVRFNYGSRSDSVNVKARSFSEAVNKAQMKRSGSKKLPVYIEVVRVK